MSPVVTTPPGFARFDSIPERMQCAQDRMVRLHESKPLQSIGAGGLALRLVAIRREMQKPKHRNDRRSIWRALSWWDRELRSVERQIDELEETLAGSVADMRSLEMGSQQQDGVMAGICVGPRPAVTASMIMPDALQGFCGPASNQRHAPARSASLQPLRPAEENPAQGSIRRVPLGGL